MYLLVTSPDLVVLSRFVEIVNYGYAFSDGCGVMGTDVARAIQETMGQTKLPGAVQVRVVIISLLLSFALFVPKANQSYSWDLDSRYVSVV